MSICYACMLLFPTVQVMEEHLCLVDKEEYEDNGGEEDTKMKIALPKPITSEQLKKHEKEKEEKLK